MKPKPPTGSVLIDLDWDSINKLIQKSPSDDGCFYMIVINKGQPGEYRTKFLTHQEALGMINLALEKKRLRIPINL